MNFFRVWFLLWVLQFLSVVVMLCIVFFRWVSSQWFILGCLVMVGVVVRLGWLRFVYSMKNEQMFYSVFMQLCCVLVIRCLEKCFWLLGFDVMNMYQCIEFVLYWLKSGSGVIMLFLFLDIFRFFLFMMCFRQMMFLYVGWLQSIVEMVCSEQNYLCVWLIVLQMQLVGQCLVNCLVLCIVLFCLFSSSFYCVQGIDFELNYMLSILGMWWYFLLLSVKVMLLM